MRFSVGAAALAAGLALGLAAPPALAQEAGSRPADDMAQVAALVDQLTMSLRGLAEGLEIEVPELGPIFAPLFENAFSGLPEEGDFSYSIGFNFETSITDAAALERRDNWTPVFADAQGCAAAEPGMSVVFFERLAVEGGAGHHCILSGRGDEDPEAWVLFATYVIETPQRRLETRTGAAATTGTDAAPGTWAEAAAIGEAQIPALIVLSGRLGETGAGMLMAAPLSSAAD